MRNKSINVYKNKKPKYIRNSLKNGFSKNQQTIEDAQILAALPRSCGPVRRCSRCGMPTHSRTGICAICAVNRRLEVYYGFTAEDFRALSGHGKETALERVA